MKKLSANMICAIKNRPNPLIMLDSIPISPNIQNPKARTKRMQNTVIEPQMNTKMTASNAGIAFRTVVIVLFGRDLILTTMKMKAKIQNNALYVKRSIIYPSKSVY